MKTRLSLAIIIAICAALTGGVAYAQGRADDRVCAGGTIAVEAGTQNQNVLLFGCSGVIRADAVVQGDVAIFGGSLIIEKGARIERDIAVLGGSVDAAGVIGNDVTVAGGSVTLRESAVVNGRVRLAGGSIKQADGSVVRGGVSQENGVRWFPSMPFVSPAYTRPFNIDWGFGRGILAALALAALGALVVAIAPLPVQRVADAAFGSVLPAAGTGCLTLLIVPVLAIALVITLVGIPIAFLLVLAAAVSWYFGWIAIGFIAGHRVLEALKVREIAPVLAVIIGVLLLAIVGEVPCIGGIAGLLIGTLGLGAVLLTRFGTQVYPPSGMAPASWPPSPVAPVAPVTPQRVAPFPLEPLPPLPAEPPATPPTPPAEPQA
ncbi:MAG: polymer-forming cytoskeletal protein [Chloroflexi bacterium]|nr:polymer-forming cytoskeletal protein [Chloroflexota bacterium]